MAPQPDFAVYSPDQKLQLVVEVKGTPHSDEVWAAKLRRNLLAHSAIPEAPYFLLVLPDYCYLWRNHHQSDLAPPDFRAETSQVLRRYLAHWNETEHRQSLSERGLAMAVRSWLLDLTQAEVRSAVGSSEMEWLQDSGLPETVRTGFVGSESAV